MYKYYGRDIIAELTGLNVAETEVVWVKLYEIFMEAIDAIDNGVALTDGTLRFKDCSNIASRIARLNPRWNEAFSDDGALLQRFESASWLCGMEFLDVLGDLVESWLPARRYVEEAFDSRCQLHPSGCIIKLNVRQLPWQDHLYTLEHEAGKPGCVKYVVYPDEDDRWRVRAVSVEGKMFMNRLPLPEPWQGLRGDALSKVAEIPGCVFAHATGFIGGHETFEGVLAMAVKALEQQKS